MWLNIGVVPLVALLILSGIGCAARPSHVNIYDREQIMAYMVRHGAREQGLICSGRVWQNAEGTKVYVHEQTYEASDKGATWILYQDRPEPVRLEGKGWVNGRDELIKPPRVNDRNDSGQFVRYHDVDWQSGLHFVADYQQGRIDVGRIGQDELLFSIPNDWEKFAPTQIIENRGRICLIDHRDSERPSFPGLTPDNMHVYALRNGKYEKVGTQRISGWVYAVDPFSPAVVCLRYFPRHWYIHDLDTGETRFLGFQHMYDDYQVPLFLAEDFLSERIRPKKDR